MYQNVTGDGLATTLAVLGYLVKTGRVLSEIVDEVELYPQIAENVRVKDKSIASHPEFVAAVEAVRMELGNAARLVVRPSGTEPLVRIFLEGKDTERLTALAYRLKCVLLSAGQQKEA
jgi:phosphoglucosamine mutase